MENNILNKDNPILVNVTRGNIIENIHRGAFAVVNNTGTVKMQSGDIFKPIYPRSSVKIFQAIPTIINGAIEKYKLTEEEIAILCSSHSGEELHIKTVKNILNKSDIKINDLNCGLNYPTDKKTYKKLIINNQLPNLLHNCCSGKHAGMLMLAKIKGFDKQEYINIKHPVQQIIMEYFENIMEYSLINSPVSSDGCSVPTWAIPLQNIALGFAKIATPRKNFSEKTSKSITILRNSCINKPFMIAGTNRCCTKIMEILKHRAFVKFGADGIYTAALPKHGLGIAIKIDDGSVKAAECVLLRLLEQIGVLQKDDKNKLMQFYKKPIKNLNKITVGYMQTSF